AFAAFRAAPLEHQPAIFGGHARTKSVRLGAASIVRLKRSLRHSDKSLRVTKTPSVTAHRNDVKEALRLAGRVGKRHVSINSLMQLQVGRNGWVTLTQSP